MARSLYICYFGVREPLVQTQVIPYLRELVKGGHELTLLTFEPDVVEEADEIRSELAADGIEWCTLRYHKRPSVPATMFDIANGARFIRKLNKTKRFDILHARSHVPMMMAALARKFGRHRPKLLFDIRGFMPEEYVDAGVWAKGGSIYRNVKRAEAWLMKQAYGYVVLTEAARDVLFPESREAGVDKDGKPVAVIPCCVDFERRFSGDREKGRAEIRKKLGIEDRVVYVHLGALGGLYLTEQIVELLAVVRERDPRTFALFLTQSDPGKIVPLLSSKGFSDSDYFVAKVPAAEVENYLYASDVGLSFVKSSYATKSRSPTKIPEYLASGLPVIANAGVGDVDDILSEDETGVIVDQIDLEGLTTSIETIEMMKTDPETQNRCIRSASLRFDLKAIGGKKYKEIYRSLAH